MVAPNGARLTKTDHPNLPMTQDEIVECAVDCYAAGADGIHAHIRDRNGQHLLDADVYRGLLEVLKTAVPDMAVQITTEAAGIYDAQTQMRVALEAGADMVSASIREIRRAGRQTAASFFAECRAREISVQHILYDPTDCALLADTLTPEDLADRQLQMIFVLGRYNNLGSSGPDELNPFLEWLATLQLKPDWAACAFGAAETECLVKAVLSGGKCRVGFENSCFLSDGSVAPGNQEKVAELVKRLNPSRATKVF